MSWSHLRIHRGKHMCNFLHSRRFRMIHKKTFAQREITVEERYESADLTAADCQLFICVISPDCGKCLISNSERGDYFEKDAVWKIKNNISVTLLKPYLLAGETISSKVLSVAMVFQIKCTLGVFRGIVIIGTFNTLQQLLRIFCSIFLKLST